MKNSQLLENKRRFFVGIGDGDGNAYIPILVLLSDKDRNWMARMDER